MTQKPEGLPSYPAMILEAVRYASEQGLFGLEPNEIVTYIQKKYWPEAPPPSVLPVVSYLRKNGKLIRHGEIDVLPGQDMMAEPAKIYDVAGNPIALPFKYEQRALRQAALATVSPTPAR